MNSAESMVEHLQQILSGTEVRLTLYHRIAIRMPDAHQKKSKRILAYLLKLTENCDSYCFLCFDPDHIEAGEVGLELSPGVKWNEVIELLDKWSKR